VARPNLRNSSGESLRHRLPGGRLRDDTHLEIILHALTGITSAAGGCEAVMWCRSPARVELVCLSEVADAKAWRQDLKLLDLMHREF